MALEEFCMRYILNQRKRKNRDRVYWGTPTA